MLNRHGVDLNAPFKVVKNQYVCPMSTYHLFEHNLSLGAKGLLSTLIALQKRLKSNCDTDIVLSELGISKEEKEKYIDELAQKGYVIINEDNLYICENPYKYNAVNKKEGA